MRIIGRPAALDLLCVNGFHETMTSSADDLVTEFCMLWATPDAEKLAAYFTKDAVYHNIPMQPLRGRTAIKEFIGGFTVALPNSSAAEQWAISDERTHGCAATQRRRRNTPSGRGNLRDPGRTDRGMAGLLRHGRDH
jgi:SnoaL-like domain